LMIELEQNGSVGVVHVVEHDAALLVESAGGENTWSVGAHKSEAVPPSARGLGIDADGANVGQRKLEMAPQRPELVDTLDVEMNSIALNRNVDHNVRDGPRRALLRDA